MLKMIIKYFRQHFGFSRSEQRGFIVLIPLLIITLFAPQMAKHYYQSLPNQITLHDQVLLKEWHDKTLRQQNIDNSPNALKKIKYFDPNTINKSEWLSLGFKPAVVERILKYIRKGGKFYKKDDLLKIYGISERLVRAYSEYIIITISKPKSNWHAKIKKDIPPAVADDMADIKLDIIKTPLNLADTSALKQVQGIGSYLSKSIVKRRNELGGFVHESQLMDVFLLNPEIIEKLLERFEIAGNHIRKIDINNVPFDSLKKHPYFSYKLSRVIVNYRNQHGEFNSTEDLLKIHILNDRVYNKIKPYVKFINQKK